MRIRSSSEGGPVNAGAAELTPVAEVVPDRCEQLASHLEHSTTAMFLFASLSNVLPDFDVASFRRYRDKLIADCGHRCDPIETMLVEQLALAHMNTGLLFHRASASGSAECATAYLAAATRLMAELRRTALALPAYREAVRRLEGREGTCGIVPKEMDHDSGLEGGEQDDEAPGRARHRAGGRRDGSIPGSA
jgi:hypothetical protein